ncbi:MAG TPA: hypothetical protein VFQ85_15740 [Mycobacteriales bacterium]|jgi:hypothetical protein|nr:hypothetical protein [Mycobacteriales bacterium]
MVTARARTLLLLLVATGVVPACGHARVAPPEGPRSHLTPLPSDVPRPGPVALPCVFPGSAADLLSLRAQTDAVVRGVVTEPATVVPRDEGPPASLYRVHVRDVVEARGEVPTDLVVATGGDASVPFLPPGEYVLFLDGGGTGPAPSTGPVYGVIEGMRGAFKVRSGRVYLECPNYAHPGDHIQATGANQGESEAAFLAMVRALPMPPKPTPGRR